MVLDWRDQARHALHLFFVIVAAVISRNVANQQLLDALGPQALGKLYITVAVVAGIGVAVIGWLAREHDPRRVTQTVHLGAAAAMALAALTPTKLGALVVIKYILMELSFASLLLGFSLLLGASLGPREARKIAARIGAGGVLGGLAGGAALSVGALLLGSRWLYLVAAVLAVLPVFWLPTPAALVMPRHTALRVQSSGERAEAPRVGRYGRWVAVVTVLMVAATTLIDYQFRYFASVRYNSDQMTAFFGVVVILANCATVVFQLTVLNRLLDRLGLFATATVMPVSLMFCSAAFGLWPVLATLMLLKVVDSGTNMSLQQATGGLLLAPLNPRSRAIWQGRIDGLAKRGGQAATGVFLAMFPWAPGRLLPVVLSLCALWIVAIVATRRRYVRLLTDMLASPSPQHIDLGATDGASLRFLESELLRSSPDRAAVILDLLEQAGRRAPEPVLKSLAEADPDGPGALRVVRHLSVLADAKGLRFLAESPHPELAAAALRALADLDTSAAEQKSRALLRQGVAEPLKALAAALLAERDDGALALIRELARSANARTRLSAAQALGRKGPGARPEVALILTGLAEDLQPEIARTALASLGRHPTPEGSEVILRALLRRDVRGAAMRALADMGPPVVPRVAEEIKLRLGEPPVASAMAWTLARIGSAAGIPALVVALRAPVVEVRLAAAVSLSAMHRRRPDLVMPHEAVAALYGPEIAYYSRMRAAGTATLPTGPASTLLLRSLRQRAHASLETLFRLMSLRYPETAMQGALAGISSNDARKRQLALELLDTLLDSPVRDAVARAVGGGKQQRRRQDAKTILRQLAGDPDPFLASLAGAVLIDMGLTPSGDAMTQSLVNQILELQSLTLFSHSTAEDLAELSQLATTRKLERGAMLFSEGEPADAMYIVRSGEVALSRSGKIIDQVGPGEACGIVAVLDQLPREMTATATTTTTLLVIAADDLLQLLADRPFLMHSVFRALTGAIRTQIDRVASGKGALDWSW